MHDQFFLRLTKLYVTIEVYMFIYNMSGHVGSAYIQIQIQADSEIQHGRQCLLITCETLQF